MTAAEVTRRGPGRPRRLSETEIVDAALRVAEEAGVAGLSMRAVARELGVPAMTIYGYVPNKEALNALVVDRVLADVVVPDPDEGSWDDRLRRLLCDARRTLAEHPELADGRAELRPGALQLLHRGGYGREASRLADGVMRLLDEGGFAAEDRQACFVVLFTYVTGHVDGVSTDATFELGARALIEGLQLVLQGDERE